MPLALTAIYTVAWATAVREETRGENAQNLQIWLGKVLRVDINGDDFPGDPARNYAVPPDNPFVGNPNALDEIWAYGVRNPWRFSFDRMTGDLLMGDVGQGAWEEIDFQPAGSAGGQNYGWDVLEAMHCYEDDPPGSCDQFLNGGSTLPVLEYSHSLGCSVTGGYRYRSQLYPQLNGLFLRRLLLRTNLGRHTPREWDMAKPTTPPNHA